MDERFLCIKPATGVGLYVAVDRRVSRNEWPSFKGNFFLKKLNGHRRLRWLAVFGFLPAAMNEGQSIPVHFFLKKWRKRKTSGHTFGFHLFNKWE